MLVYDKEPYIRDTIASFLAQTFFSYEVVMIGGVSSEKTDAICREFAAAEPTRFRFVVQCEGKVRRMREMTGFLWHAGGMLRF